MDISATIERYGLPMRVPDVVMRPERMGAFHATRMSFSRRLVRELIRDRAKSQSVHWSFDQAGFGRGVATVRIGGHAYSLCAFTQPLASEERSDRVIATKWDATFALFDGKPEKADLDRIEKNASRQENGRFEPTEIILSRANKSGRLFEHVVDRLAQGKQPDRKLVENTGYLMRTTAVYGNGKFGITDRNNLAGRQALDGPFAPEMLTVWMIRNFTLDLVEHIARKRSPSTAARLSPQIALHLGIGNATGLGMVPFLVKHPVLLDRWMTARETALARVRAKPVASDSEIDGFRSALNRAITHLEAWRPDCDRLAPALATLRHELEQLQCIANPAFFCRRHPWHALACSAENRSLEYQEMLVSLLLEPHPDLVDMCCDDMASDHDFVFFPAMTVGQLRDSINDHCGWVFGRDYLAAEERCKFWYYSAEKREPRFGTVNCDSGSESSLPMDVASRITDLAREIRDHSASDTVAELLVTRPHLRFAVRRVQTASRYAYSEIRSSLVGGHCVPVDLLRCKLSFFGATKFDPKSDLWLRVNLFQGAPTARTIALSGTDDWCFPSLAE